MDQPGDNSALTILMIYGWEANPYPECVVQALHERGVHVVFAARKQLRWRAKEQAGEIVGVFPGYRNGKSVFAQCIFECGALAKLVQLVLTMKPDIIHFQSFRMIKLDWIFFLCLKILRKKIVFTIHDTQSHMNSSIDDVIMQYVSTYCDTLFVHTEYSKKVLTTSWNIPESKICVVPHGSYDAYYDCAIPKTEARERLGYRDVNFVLLFFGIIRESKGLDYLLSAVADAKSSIPNLNLIIAGRALDVALEEAYRQRIIELGLEQDVTYESRFIEDSEVADCFRACDLVVLPYLHIDQSGVLCLSFTFGRPVLATRVGGVPEMVQDGVTGYTVPPADAHALAQKIIEIWRQPQRLEKMGLRARQLMDETYTWRELAEVTTQVYRRLKAPVTLAESHKQQV
jgi:glycosyltransferase involved in cell wall biosynthesis